MAQPRLDLALLEIVNDLVPARRLAILYFPYPIRAGCAMIAPAGSETGADRQPEAAPWDGSRRLWSLWDMLRFYAEKLVVVDRYLTQLSIATHDPNIRQFDPSTLSLFKEKFAELSQTLEELGLPISKEICDELAVKLSAEPAPVPADLGGFVGRLFDIVRREIKSVYFIALSISERGFLTRAPHCGRSILRRNSQLKEPSSLKRPRNAPLGQINCKWFSSHAHNGDRNSFSSEMP